MRLIDLDPRWLVLDGVKVGFVFRSPTNQKWYQSCLFKKTSFKDQCKLLQTVNLVDDEGHPQKVQTCNADCDWTWFAGTSFEDISITPSLDGSAGGLWHGHITNGEIIGA